ncbi:MAG: hypothetical protein JNM14_04365 [Ferruginibacter sp.]|nr:hypothetical protein [Ferruginibacter sp.]
MKKDKHQSINRQAAKIAMLKKSSAAAAKPAKPKKPKAAAAAGVAPEAIAIQVANLVVEFHDVDAGLSDFTATHNGADQTIHESGTISFKNVKTNDTITIKGDSAGSTIVNINGVQAVPMQMSFDAGQHIGGLFLITS